jgi:hypothetical protein
MTKNKPGSNGLVEWIDPRLLRVAHLGHYSYLDAINLVAAQNPHLTLAQVTCLLARYIERDEKLAQPTELLSFAFALEAFTLLASEYVSQFGSRPAVRQALDNLCAILEPKRSE